MGTFKTDSRLTHTLAHTRCLIWSEREKLIEKSSA
jgi:hypothetical protein